MPLHCTQFNPPVVLESRKGGSKREEGKKVRGRKEREKEGRKEGRKEGTVKTDGVNLTREDDRKVKESVSPGARCLKPTVDP